MTPTEIRRFHRIVRVFLEYGVDTLLPKSVTQSQFFYPRRALFWLKNSHHEKAPGERLRLALQELGPVWIKFGQMLSTRRDLFPAEIADQLALLQDQVAPFSSELARAQIEQALGGKLEQWFADFDPEPLASASIAQVHTATLLSSQKQVVIKVLRPDIEAVIAQDVKLMFRLARMLVRLVPQTQRLRPVEVVAEYEKTLITELDLRCEAANAIQLRRNFENDRILYVPEVYSDFCRKRVMVSERIYGIGVADLDKLKAHGVDLKLLAERGVQVFFTQVFRDSFFHADMHPGNVFVSYETPEDPTWIGIDCGIVGTLNSEDKRYLAENFLAFFCRDYRKVAQLHVASGWVPFDTNINDFEAAIRTVCEPIFEKQLGDISFGHVLLSLFNTARRFNMQVQPQLVLLQKTLLYVEGLGRQLYPQLDLWGTAKPFLDNWVNEQIGPQALLNAIQDKVPLWTAKLPQLPELLYGALAHGQQFEQRIDSVYRDYMQTQRIHNRGKFLFGVGAVLLILAGHLYQDGVTREPLMMGSGALVSWFLSWRALNK